MQGSEIRSCFLIDKATKEPVDSINLKRGDTVVLYGTADHSSATFTGWSSAGDIRIGIGYADLAAAVQAGTVLRLDTGASTSIAYTQSTGIARTLKIKAPVRALHGTCAA